MHDGKGHKKWHHEGNDDDDHYGHGHGKHGKHGKHGWHDKHHEWSAKDMVRASFLLPLPVCLRVCYIALPSAQQLARPGHRKRHGKHGWHGKHGKHHE